MRIHETVSVDEGFMDTSFRDMGKKIAKGVSGVVGGVASTVGGVVGGVRGAVNAAKSGYQAGKSAVERGAFSGGGGGGGYRSNENPQANHGMTPRFQVKHPIERVSGKKVTTQIAVILLNFQELSTAGVKLYVSAPKHTPDFSPSWTVKTKYSGGVITNGLTKTQAIEVAKKILSNASYDRNKYVYSTWKSSGPILIHDPYKKK